jgi:hypothetical protein
MGSLVDWNMWNIRILAFFPVVAISSTLSTSFCWHKANKNNRD